jgi:hypothetical protein
MIRIDEIYCNTFLPKLQTHPLKTMHWFHPFGSVKFDDLCSMPLLTDPGAIRYLFWDQEPLIPHMIDQTLSAFTSNFTGELHIVTSEFNSEMVEHVERTYGFKSHYYFFHGWAVLDWFRGYNRSFLMKPPEHRRITKTFIAPNRIVGGDRQHRLHMLYHIFKSKMTDNWISCPQICPGENIPLTDSIKPLVGVLPDIETVFAQQQLPINFPNETGHPMNSAWLDLFDECADCLLYVATETAATGRRQHLTEKTFKPIVLRMPFVIVGCCGSLEYLRRYGFRTFSTLWDESYDQETNDVQRYQKIAGVLKELDSVSVSEKQRIFDQAQDICQHNYDHFYNGGFEEILWQELTGMIDEF